MKVILVSHGQLANGMKNTIEMIAGKQKNLEAYEAYQNGINDDSFIDDIRKVAIRTNHVIVVTDVLGGSVNNEMLQLLRDHHNIFLLTGMNLPLILTLVTVANKELTKDDISAAIKAGKEGVLFINKLIEEDRDGGNLL